MKQNCQGNIREALRRGGSEKLPRQMNAHPFLRHLSTDTRTGRLNLNNALLSLSHINQKAGLKMLPRKLHPSFVPSPPTSVYFMVSLILHVYFVCFYFPRALECVYRVTCHFAQCGFRQITLPSVSFPGSAPSTLPSLPRIWLLFQLQANKWAC